MTHHLAYAPPFAGEETHPDLESGSFYLLTLLPEVAEAGTPEQWWGAALRRTPGGDLLHPGVRRDSSPLAVCHILLQHGRVSSEGGVATASMG